MDGTSEPLTNVSLGEASTKHCEPDQMIDNSKMHHQYEQLDIHVYTATLAFKALHTGHLLYLSVSDLPQYHKSTKSTRSSASHLFSLPQHNLSFGSHAFHTAAPKVWNALPSNILECQIFASFRRHLKTYLLSVSLSCLLASI